MFPLKLNINDADRNKIVSEDISPILKENQAQNCVKKYDLKSNVQIKNDTSEEDSDDTKHLISKLNTVNISSKNVDIYRFPGTSNKEIGDTKKSNVLEKKNIKPPTKIRNKSKKENIDIFTQISESGVEESKTTKVRRVKKKNSFIVSDDSSFSNDSLTLYHRILTEHIKADVRKITPRSRLRKSISSTDDGIFTPYIIGKRSSSDSSFSDEEEGNTTPIKFKSSRREIHSPLFPNTEPKDNDTKQNETNSANSSSDIFREKSKKERPVLSTPTNSLPASISKSPVPKNFLKDMSWIFTDDDSTSGDEKKTKDNVSESTNIKLLKDKSTQSGKKIMSKEKLYQSNEKTLVTQTPITFRLKQIKNLTPVTKFEKEEPLSFLDSLSINTGSHTLHPEAEPYKKKFKKLRQELTSKLFNMFNEQVFENQLPSDLKIEWNARLRSSSGLCYNRRIKNVIGPNNECLRASRIALSTKIIETPDRLRDTLIHEMCHAAAWIIDNQCDGHGPRWRSWAVKACKTFPELPMIRRCHDYDVKTKFKYKCVKCGYTIGRHSKSLNLERKRCGYCYGKFELIVSHVAKSDIASSSTSPKNVKARPLSKFALFVKENYGKIKSEKPDLKHGEIMKELSKSFALTKISN